MQKVIETRNVSLRFLSKLVGDKSWLN